MIVGRRSDTASRNPRRDVAQHDALAARETRHAAGEHHAGRRLQRAARIDDGAQAIEVHATAEIVIRLRRAADHGGELEDHVRARRDGLRRQVGDVAGEAGDGKSGPRLWRGGDVEQRERADPSPAQCAIGGEAFGDAAAEKAVGAENRDAHPWGFPLCGMRA
jgi:hypothetical protein